MSLMRVRTKTRKSELSPNGTDRGSVRIFGVFLSLYCKMIIELVTKTPMQCNIELIIILVISILTKIGVGNEKEAAVSS